MILLGMGEASGYSEVAGTLLECLGVCGCHKRRQTGVTGLDALVVVEDTAKISRRVYLLQVTAKEQLRLWFREQPPVPWFDYGSLSERRG